MAKKDKDEGFREFKIPEALPAGYTFTLFAEYVIDRVPEFQSVSGARKGGKLLDAVARALEGGTLVRWPEDLWSTVCKYLNSAQFQMPQNRIIVGGAVTEQLLSLRSYLPMADAILDAVEVKEEAQPEPPAAPVQETN